MAVSTVGIPTVREVHLALHPGEVPVGQRTSSETVVAIIVAFCRKPVWSQAALGRECGVTSRVVRRYIDELLLSGWPLEIEEDHPHVYFSVPKGWFPAGVFLEGPDIAALLHMLLRVPASRERTQLLKVASGHVPPVVVEALARIVPPKSSEVEEGFLPTLLDALARRQTLRIRYLTVSRAAWGARTVSIQRVLLGPPTRFIAHCHTALALRWFRLDAVGSVSADAAQFHEVDDLEVEAFIDTSVDGFRGSLPVKIAFFVRDPDARWVAQNLPDGLAGTPEGEGLLVEAETAGLLPVARFVVGLGGAAECRTPELAALVRELARGALDGSRQE